MKKNKNKTGRSIHLQNLINSTWSQALESKGKREMDLNEVLELIKAKASLRMPIHQSKKNVVVESKEEGHTRTLPSTVREHEHQQFDLHKGGRNQNVALVFYKQKFGEIRITERGKII